MECVKSKATLCFSFLVLGVEFVSAQEGCYGAGSVVTSVVITVIITFLVLTALYYWLKRRPKSEHLILETDPEKGNTEYAFDNPGFKEITLLQKPQKKSPTKNETEKGLKKWNNWTGISGLTTKPEKWETMDDSSMKEQEIKVVSLKSHDFAGLGFNICGNMKEGIYIKDILHRGPASESGKLRPGDRIHNITINFEHIVYEDALNILSFASPYEIIVEAKGGKILFGSSSKSDYPSHPIYRSSSYGPSLKASNKVEKSLYVDANDVLQKSLSSSVTLKGRDSKSSRISDNQMKSQQNDTFNVEDLKNQLEQKIIPSETEMRLRTQPVLMTAEIQKTENKHQKFGIKVFPTDIQRSPKSMETSQNDNNTNMEKHTIPEGTDEVKEIYEDQNEEPSIELEGSFDRNDILYGSGLKRDENGIPQEIPSHMLNAAFAARRNRKNQDETMVTKKIKGKAPSPPTESLNSENGEMSDHTLAILNSQSVVDLNSRSDSFNQDSEYETDKHSSVTTIELNACDVTIHQGENEDKKKRKTASTGDLTKISTTNKSKIGILERAQSLDITDSGIPNLSKKTKGEKDVHDINTFEETICREILSKESTLSLVLGEQSTFQRNSLKKSTEWGDLEDAILISNSDEDIISPAGEYESPSNSREEKSTEFYSVANKINEIKKEPEALQNVEMIESDENLSRLSYESQKPKNVVWPTETETSVTVQKLNPIQVRLSAQEFSSDNQKKKMNIINEIWPKELEKTENEERCERSETSVTSPTYKIDINETNAHSIVEMPKRVVSETEDQLDDISIEVGNTIMSKSSSEPIIELEVMEKTSEETTSTSVHDLVGKSTETMISKRKTHKRQQIPIGDNNVCLPPQSEEINDEILSLTETSEIKCDYIIAESLPSCSKGNFLEFSRNSETGELCAAINNTHESNTFRDKEDLNDRFSYTENDSYDNTFGVINLSNDQQVNHSFKSLDRRNSDDTKPMNSIKYQKNVSNVTINDASTSTELASLRNLELPVNESASDSLLSESELYTKTLNQFMQFERESNKISINTPDLIKNVTITEAINTLNGENKISRTSGFTINSSEISDTLPNNDAKPSSLTYITEIKVTPTESESSISDIEIVQPIKKTNSRKTSKTELECPNENLESDSGENKELKMYNDSGSTNTNNIINKLDPEREFHEIEETTQTQLKKLPEMRFSTSSYENPSRTLDKRQSQVELLKSNFEKPSLKMQRTEVTKSRIPISTVMKTPPTTPDHKERNINQDVEKEIFEISSPIHHRPMVNSVKYQKPNNTKNITVTSIRSNSRIPSGLPVGGIRPPVSPKRMEQENDSLNSNSNISSFKQWVFNPVNSPTNISTSGRQDQN